jgi:hypothetical protein
MHQAGANRVRGSSKLIARKMFVKSFCENHFPHKSVNLFFTHDKDELTDLWGNGLLQNNFTNTLCEIKAC